MKKHNLSPSPDGNDIPRFFCTDLVYSGFGGSVE